MINRKWFELSQSLIQVYTQSQIAYKYKKLPLQYFHIAIAKFSGPIAILYNKYLFQQVQVKLPQQNQNSIMIFNPKGQLKRMFPFEMKDRVILFKFTQLQELMILYASGQYVLIDPYSGKRFQGTFFIGQDEVNKTGNERCVGGVLNGEQLFVIRQKQFGIVKSFKNYWTALPNLKPNVQNPVFTIENLSHEKKRMSGSALGFLIYLSKQSTIEEYNPQNSIKRIIFEGEYLKANGKNLVCISKRQHTLILIFRNPFKILYITLTQSSLKSVPQVNSHDPLIELKQRIEISKKKSKHNYMSLNHEIIWLGDSNIAAYNNGKVLVIFDSENIKAIYNHHTETKMIYSVVEEIDGFRVIGEQHTLYRQVSQIYQELVSLESLEEAQFKLFANNHQLAKEKQLLRQRLLNNKVEEFQLTPKQKQLIIHQLHQIYQKYINKQMIPISDLNSLKPFAGPMLKEIIENGVKCLDKLQLIKIMKFATFVMNYFTFSVSKKDRQSDIRMSQLKLMESQDDLSIPNSGNLCSFLSTPIHELCSQLRILNTLKYSTMKRFLTIEEFHFLKYQMKDMFIDIMLRYNMHYELDLMFGDSQAKAKIFYHWAKCKIQKENPQNNRSTPVDSTDRQQSLGNSPNDSSDSLVFQTIIEKYESLKEKFYPNNNLFSELAKYCVDRNKLNLGLKLLQNQQDPEKKALVGLLILVAKKDRHLVQKVLLYTENSKKSQIVYRVIKQLLHLNWIEKHLWTNLFHNRLMIEEHFIKYNEFIYMWDNVKDYFLQNKMLVDLGYMGIRQTIWGQAKQIVKKEQIDKNEIGTRCLFNSEENEDMRQKMVSEFQSLVPNTCLALKKHSPKPKSGLMILKRFKKQSSRILQEQIDSAQSSLTDKQLQYLGQILLQKDDNKQLATYVFMKIRSEKSYRILLRQAKYKQAIDLAYERRNLAILREVIQTIHLVTQQSEGEFLLQYGEAKIREIENKAGK